MTKTYIEEYGADVLQDEGTRQFVWESKHPPKDPETHWEKWGTGVALVDSNGKVLAVDYDFPDSDGPARPETPDEYRKLDKEVSKLWEESRFKSVKYGSPAYNRVVELLQKSGVAFLAADFGSAIGHLQEAKKIIDSVAAQQDATAEPAEEPAQQAVAESAAAAEAPVEIDAAKLPELTGSPKQIAWATEIRAEALTRILKTIAPNDCDGKKLAYAWVCENTSSSYWIGHRQYYLETFGVFRKSGAFMNGVVLPELTGSPKQIAWATEIRAGCIRCARRLLAARGGEQADIRKKLADDATTQTKAKYWIDLADISDENRAVAWVYNITGC